MPPRLPQPQPDVARRPSRASSTSRTRAWVRTPTISSRCCATPTSTSRSRSSTSSICDFLARRRATPRIRPSSAAVRPDGAAAQSQGARHVRLPDDGARAIPSTSQYIPRTLRLRPRDTLATTTASRRLRDLLAHHVERAATVTPDAFRPVDAPVPRRAPRARGTSNASPRTGFASSRSSRRGRTSTTTTRRHVAETRRGSTSSGCRRWSMHAPISDGFIGGVWGRAYSNASTDARGARGGDRRNAAAIEAARELGCCGGRPAPRHPARPADSAGDNDVRRRRAAASSRSPRRAPRPASGSRSKSFPTTSPRRRRCSTGSRATSSSATRRLPGRRPRAPASAARPRPPRRSSGHIITHPRPRQRAARRRSTSCRSTAPSTGPRR